LSRDHGPDQIEKDTNRDRPWFKRRKVMGSVLVTLGVILAFGLLLIFPTLSAKTNLEQARSSAQQAKDSLLQGNTAEAARFAGEAQSHAQSARDATHSVSWNIASAIPLLGRPFKAGQQISDVVLGLADSVLKPTADAGTAIAPSQLFADGRLDVNALRREEPTLSTIAEKAKGLNAEAQAIADPLFLPMLGTARSQLQAQTADIAQLMANTAIAAKLAPPLMGADGPRSYFMGFQTNAEARGTGGLLGAFGILRFDDGEPSVDELGPNNELLDDRASFKAFSLGPEFDEQYGFTNATTDVRNSNQSSHFPYAAQIWRSMWEQESGMTVDGAIAIDPVALSYILGATGPATLPDGETVTAANVVELTESSLYIRFPADQKARKQYLQDIATEVVKKITKPLKSPRKLFDALGRAVSERRIAVWSSNPIDQKLLEETPLAHVIPDDAAPYAEVVINNLGGNKLDYYLKRQIEYVADRCKGDTRNSTVSVRLSNEVPDAETLPDYVAGRMGFFPELGGNIPKGTMISSVRLLATQGAQLGGALVNGKRVPVMQRTERGHPSFEVQVAIPAGKSADIAFRLSEPTAPGHARVPFQPLKDQVTPLVSVPNCPG